MNQAITEAVYTCIAVYIAGHGFAPSQREIAEHCYISRGAVNTHLNRLEKQNRIIREVGVARGIRLVEEKNGQMHGHMSTLR